MIRHRARTMRAATLLACLGAFVGAEALANVTFVVRVPASTPVHTTVWLSGDRPELGSWNGGGLRLRPGPDGSWHGSLELPPGTGFEFKVTRGTWETVEKNAQGAEIANRGWTVTGNDTLVIAVEAWRDQTEPHDARAHTVTGDVRRHAALPSKIVRPRDVLVWLPPGYAAEKTSRYPVVYFHDGQNVFDGATSFLPGAEWGADETANRLIRAHRIPPCILVAVANTPARMDEYTSAADARHGGGRSSAYFRFLVEELQPFVNQNYRTLTDASHTAVIGSSLGGLAALDLGLSHPERFGLVACISPAVWWAGGAIVKRVRSGVKQPLRVWLDIGTAESTGGADPRRWVVHARSLQAALVERGWREGVDLHYEEVVDAAHSERAWAARLDRIFEFLLARR